MRELGVAAVMLFVIALPAEAFVGCAALQVERVPTGDVPEAIATRLSALAVHFAVAAGPSGTLRAAVSHAAGEEVPSPYPASSPRHYRAIVPGALLGVISLSEGWRDARGEQVAAGLYTLRYAPQPRMKDHFGTAERADFALLIPIVADDASEISADEAISLSRGTERHPVVMMLAPVPPAAAPPCICSTDDGDLLVVDVGGTAIGIVIGATSR